MAQVTRTDTDPKAVVASIPTDHRRHVRNTRSTRTGGPLTMAGVLSTTRHLRQPWEETPCSLVRWLEISALIGGTSDSPDTSDIEQKPDDIFALLYRVEWIRADGRSLPGNAVEVSRGMLEIRGVTRNDEGRYTCRGIDQHGNVMFQVCSGLEKSHIGDLRDF